MRRNPTHALRGDLSPSGLWFVHRPLTGRHPEVRRWQVIHVPTARICTSTDRKRDAIQLVEELERRAQDQDVDLDTETLDTVSRRLQRLGIAELITRYSRAGW